MTPPRRRRTDREHYRPRGVEPLAVVATAERLFVAEGHVILRRELTADESKLCVGLAQYVAPTVADLEDKVARLQEDLIVLRRLTGEAS